MLINKVVSVNQLKYQARRGNLETDLLLQAFIEHKLCHETDLATLSAFESLLSLDDQTLMTCLLQPALAKAKHAKIIQLIRKNYLNSTN
ncbi:succinate dehydrogenase assembly factor 2 [Thiomicrospira microaerophila]|uniref:FAD assembly factor SdhE n=1 Tax=Thiomicrospira microaerophila TaxID=406020 RepID=UPI0020108F29|nr:succinate dehydrogenase assembly factor 2 [Thiomicrospira microaerophila]UQB41416.1 succinate dehydrogenase assembly factor 2 [Thiomicrospira microaerophila]